MMKGMEKEDEEAELQKAFEGKSILEIKFNYFFLSETKSFFSKTCFH